MSYKQVWPRMALLCGWLSGCFSGALLATEYEHSQVTAAFIYQISKFITWPEEALPSEKTSFGLCVFGHLDAGLGQALQALAQQKTRGRSVRVLRLANTYSLLQSAGSGDCQIIFSANGNWQELTSEEVEQLRRQHALLIGLSRNFLAGGGMLALIPHKDSLGIFVNMSSLQDSGVKADSRLLQLATIL